MTERDEHPTYGAIESPFTFTLHSAQ